MNTSESVSSSTAVPVRVGFVLHVMQVAGAEVLTAEIIRRLGTRIQPVVLCLDGIGALGEQLLAEGVEVVALGRQPGLDWRCLIRLSTEISRRRLHVLHAHQYSPFFYGGIAARIARSGTAVIFTEHGRHYPDLVSTKRRVFNRWLLRRCADRITSVSDFGRIALAKLDGFGLDDIEVIENGIELSRYGPAADKEELKSRLGLDVNRRFVVCIARFHPVKDHRMLVDAFARVAGSKSDVDLLLVGDGPLRPALTEQVSRLGLEGRVRFLGVRADVPQLLAASDVFALVSVSEAASITLLEAMASGVPVVVTNVGGNGEMISQGVHGELVPRGDATAAAASMARVLDDAAYAAGISCRAADRVRERFQIERTVARYHELYRSLAAR